MSTGERLAAVGGVLAGAVWAVWFLRHRGDRDHPGPPYPWRAWLRQREDRRR